VNVRVIVVIGIIGIAASVVPGAAPVSAQDRPTISLAVPDPARWDAGGYVGWVGGQRVAVGSTFDQWSDAASFSASGGYYWTPHVKVELQFAATTWDEVFVQSSFDNGASFRFGQQRSRTDRLTAAVHYQFFENTWFHPFAAAGVTGTRESTRLELSEQRICPPLPCISVPLPVESAARHYARPFVGTGFKWYLTERAFIRSDLGFVLAASDRASVQWHTGFGLDF
jgi:hypothetical protein